MGCAANRLGGKERGQLRGGLGFHTVSEAIQHPRRKNGNGSCMILEIVYSGKFSGERRQLVAVRSIQIAMPC